MKTKHTTRYSLLMIVVLVVMLGIVTGLTLNVSTGKTVAFASSVVDFGDFTGTFLYDGTESLDYDTNSVGSPLELTLGTDPGAYISATFTDNDTSDPIATDVFYRTWDGEGTDPTDNFYDKTTSAPMHAGQYRKYWHRYEDETAILASVDFVILPSNCAVTLSEVMFYYTGNPVSVTVSVDPAMENDLTAVLTWDGGEAPTNPGVYNYTITLEQKENFTTYDVRDYRPDPAVGSITIGKRQLDVSFEGTVPYTGLPQCVVTVSYVPQSTGEQTLLPEDFAALAEASYLPLDVVYTKMYTSVLEYNSETGYDEWVEHSEAGSGYTVGIDIIEEYRNRFYIDDGGNEVYNCSTTQYIEKANIPNSVLSLGGDFGSTFQIGENNYWPAGDDILDRIVVAIESIPGYSQGGVPYIHNDAIWEWAPGLIHDDAEASAAGDPFANISTFNPNTAAANIGDQFTIRVQVDANGNTNYETSYVYLPVTVGKVKTFIRPVTGTLTYNGTAQQPEATIYQYKISGGTTIDPGIVVENATVSQTNVGTYDMVVGFNGNYGDTYEFVADEGARFTIQPATLTPSISIDNLDPDAIVYGEAVVISREGVGEEDMLGPGEGIKVTQGIYDYVEYRYQPAGGEWSEWDDLIDEATQLKNVGEYELRYNFTCTGVEVSGDYYVNYVSAGADTVSFTIVKKDLEVNVDAKETTYGSAAPAFTVSYDGFEYGETAAVLVGEFKFECDYDIEDANNRDTGTYPILIEHTLTSANYQIIYTDNSLTVNKKGLTCTANDKTITYGDAPANDGVAYSGWVYGDDSSDFTGALQYIYNYSQYDNVGSYTITPSGLYSSNYDITFNAGTLTVEQLEVVISWSGIEGFTAVYDGQYHTMIASITNIQNGDEVATSLSEYRARNAGAHTAVVDELTGAKAGNYKLPSAAVNKSQAWSITPAPLTITAENKSVTFSDAAPTYTVTYDGFVGGQDASVLSGELAFTCAYAVGSNVGDYSITPSGLANDNYDIDFVAGTLTVNKMTITITPNANQKKTYGDDDPTLNYIYSETYNSQELIFTGALGRVAGENVGTYAITLGTLALTDAAVNQNYELELAAAPVNFTIDKRTLAFDWETEFVFNGQDQKPVVENVEGLQNGHVWGTDVDIEWTDGNTIDAGSWTGAWGMNFILTGTQAGNYTCGSFKVDLTITARPLTVAWYLDGNLVTTGASVVYSGTEHVLTAVAGNTCGGDVVTLQLGGRVNYTKALEGMNASVTAKEYNANGSAYANYKIESGLANREFVWTISQKEVTLIWANYDLVYNGQSQKPTAEVNPTSLVPADSELQLTVTVIGGQIWSNEKAGFAYNAEATTLSGTGASNYKFAQSTLTHTFTIAQKEVGFDWEDLELVYNKTAQKPIAYATGLEGSDICNVTVTGAETYVGEYVATVTGLTGEDALNYKLPESGLEQEYSIVPKVLEVDFNNTGFTYDGEEHAPLIILTGIEAGDDVEGVFEDGYGAQIDAGDYTAIVGALDGSDADNYALPDDEADRSIVFCISKRQIKLSTILDDPLVVTYGDSIPNMPSYYVQVDPSSTYDFLGDPSDVITVTVAQYNDLNQLVPIMDLSEVGDAGNYWLYVINLDEDNYDIVTLFDNVTDKLVISPKEVSFGWSGAMFDYDGQPHNPSIIVYGLETGDECEVTLTDAAVNAGNYTVIALELSNTNYKLPTNAADRECEFSIAPRIVELAWDHDSFLYDGEEHSVLATITNVVAGDEVSVEFYSGAMSCVNANDGSYYGTTATTLTGANKNNYTLTGAEATHNWTINPRSAAIKLFVDGEATDQQVVNVVYDGQEHTFEIKYQGVGDNNWLLLIDGGAFTSVGGDGVSYDEDYEINVNYFGNKDYDFEWGVAAKPITVTYTGEHKVVVYEDEDMWDELGVEMEDNGWYLDADIAVTDNLFDIISVGLKDENGDPVVADPSLGYGIYDLLVVANGAKAGNYNVTINLGEEAYLEVVKTFATLTAPTAKTGLVYTGQAQALVNAGTDVHGGELQYRVGEGEWSATVPSITNAGSYAVSWRVVPDENHSAVSGELGTIVVEKATHDMSGITFAPIDVVYDGLAHIATISGQLPAGVQVSYEVNSLTNAGETLAVAIFAVDEVNFNAIANMTAPVKVRKASLTVTADAKSITYGDAAPQFTVSYLGFVNDETDIELAGTLAFACNYAQGSAAGAYDIVPSGLTAANYDIAFVNGVLTVGKKDITVTAANKTSVYGKALATLTATVSPALVGSDAESAVFTLSTTATITSKPGQYPINVVPANNANYNVTVVAGVYMITEAPVEHRGEGENTVNVYGKEITEAEAKKGVSVTELFSNANADTATSKEVEIEAGAVTIVFNADAISAIASATGEITMSVEVVDEEGYAMAINVSLTGATFDQGTATVKLPYNEEIPSGKVPVVYFIGEDGSKTAMKTWVENGVVMFEAPHFSKYALAIEDAPKGLSGGAIAGIVIAVVIVLAGAAVAVVLVLKKQGKLGKKAEPKDAKEEPQEAAPQEEAKEQEEPKEE